MHTIYDIIKKYGPGKGEATMWSTTRTISDALLPMKDEKPEEYAAYYAFCEECKAYVKAKKNVE